MEKSKIILGINSYHADSSACLMIGGKLIAAIEEERLNRIKHYAGFPLNAIKECLKISDLKEDDITDIAFNTKPLSNLIPKGIHYLKNLLFRENLQKKNFLKKKNISNLFKEYLKLSKDIKFHYIEHHLAHIASAFYPSKFINANGLSIDGSGDFVSLAISKCTNNNIEIIKKYFFPNSLGIFYHAMTQFLGFNNYGDEYKIMGMAAYGKPKYFDILKNNLFLENGKKLKLNLNYFNHHKPNFRYIADENLIIDKIFNKKLSSLFKLEREKIIKNDTFSKDLAASIQKVYEHFFEKIIIDISKLKYSENLVYAGGCGLNSSANRIITENKKYFKHTYIPFAPGDNGGALGAAFVVSSKYNNKIINSNNPFLGKSYDNQYIKDILDKDLYNTKTNYKYIKNEKEFFKIAAEMISQGNVIGWFQNKMEFGPRALGNRSILADPRNPNMKDIINSKIKRRESFRPFAPSVLEEYQSDWFETKYMSPYMSTISKVKKNKINLVPAITHIDETARYQSVSDSSNKMFYELIKTFYQITGIPIILNTSFNENEPIVMSPEEALDCLIRTEMDGLFLNNFFVKKN